MMVSMFEEILKQTKKYGNTNTSQAPNPKMVKTTTVPQESSMLEQILKQTKKYGQGTAVKNYSAVAVPSVSKSTGFATALNNNYLSREAEQKMTLDLDNKYQNRQKQSYRAAQEQLSHLEQEIKLYEGFIHAYRAGGSDLENDDAQTKLALLNQNKKQLADLKQAYRTLNSQVIKATEQQAVIQSNQDKIKSYTELTPLAQQKERQVSIAENKTYLKGTGQHGAVLGVKTYNDRYGNKEYSDNFPGQLKANYLQGRLAQDSYLAWNKYLTEPTAKNRAVAVNIDQLLSEFRTKNRETLKDDAKLPWISQSLAGYLPQLLDQTKMAVTGGVVGGAVGSVVPGIGTVLGAKTGIVAGSSKYAYDLMRGAAFADLLSMGIDEATARKAAGDEGVLSSLIEAGDTIVDLGTLGVGSMLKTVFKTGVKKASGQGVAKKLAKSLAKYGINIGGEALQEGSQEMISIANENRVKNGNSNSGLMGLTKDSFNMVGNLNAQEKQRVLTSAAEGAKIAAMVGGATILGNKGIEMAFNSGKENKPQKTIANYTPDNSLFTDGLNNAKQSENKGSVADVGNNHSISGKVTVIKNPYNGTVPVQNNSVTKNSILFNNDLLEQTQKQIEHSQFVAQQGEQSFSKNLKEIYSHIFSRKTDVPIGGVSFQGSPYLVNINNSVPEKIINEGVTAEKLVVLNDIENVVKNGVYVGSSTYIPHGAKRKHTIRFDHFEADVSINRKPFVVAFEVEAFPNINNYKTHRITKIELMKNSDASTGPLVKEAQPAAKNNPTTLTQSVPQNNTPDNSLFTDGLNNAKQSENKGSVAVQNTNPYKLTALDVSDILDYEKDWIVYLRSLGLTAQEYREQIKTNNLSVVAGLSSNAQYNKVSELMATDFVANADLKSIGIKAKMLLKQLRTKQANSKGVNNNDNFSNGRLSGDVGISTGGQIGGLESATGAISTRQTAGNQGKQKLNEENKGRVLEGKRQGVEDKFRFSLVEEGDNKIILIDNPNASTQLNTTEKEMLTLFKNLTGDKAIVTEADKSLISLNRRGVSEFLRSNYVKNLADNLKNVVYLSGRQLDEMIKYSEPISSYPNTDSKHRYDASKGWEHREVIFEAPYKDNNNNVSWKRFTADLIVRKNDDGNFSHGLIGIKKEGSASYGASRKDPSIISAEPSLIDPILSQDNHGVNNIISTKPLQDAKKDREQATKIAQQGKQDDQLWFSISYDANNEPYVVIDKDILFGVPKSEWVKTVKNVMKEKFADGFEINNWNIGVNNQSRREFTNSEYTKKVSNKNNNNINDNTYTDKMKMANNLDEISKFANNLRNEDPKHPRKDKIRSFNRGQVRIKVGDNSYLADVITGITQNNREVFYDIINLKSIQINNKTSPQRSEWLNQQLLQTGEVFIIDPILSQDNHGVNNIISKIIFKDVKKARAKQKRLAQQRNENFRQHPFLPREVDGVGFIKLVPKNKYDSEMQATQHDYAVKGVAVEFFYDDVPVKTSRGLKKARGFYVSESGIIYVKANDEHYSIKQLTDHEYFHHLAHQDTGLVSRIQQGIRETFGEDNLNTVIKQYESVYSAICDNANEYLEEILADAYGGINVFEYVDVVKREVNNLQTQAINDTATMKFSLNPNFTAAYDNWVNKYDRRKDMQLLVGNTSEALQSIGVKEHNIYWDTGKINKTLEKHHNLSDEILKQIPNILENPIIILESKSLEAKQTHANNNRIIIFGDVIDKNGLPVLAVLELEPTNKKGLVLNEIKVASTYSKIPHDKNNQMKDTQDLINESRILYIEPNKKRTHSWLVSNRLQLPFDIINYGSIGRISYKNDPVNSQYMQNEEKNALTALEIAFKKAQDKNNTNNIKFSLSADNFNKQVDDVLANKLSPINAVLVRKDTPKILLDVGLEQKIILMTQKHIRDMNKTKIDNNHKYHGLDAKLIKKLPSLLSEPVMIMDSLSTATSSGIVVVTNEVDADGLPIIVSINPNGKGFYLAKYEKSNFVTSAYGRNSFDKFIQHNIDEDTFLFLDKQKSHDLFTRIGLQLPQRLNKYGFDNIIRKSNNIVNTSISKKAANDTNNIKFSLSADTPRSIANTSKDSVVLPKVSAKGKQNTGDSESKLAGSLQASSIFDDKFKKLSLEDMNINSYNKITNKETMEKANQSIDLGGQPFVNHWLSKNNNATADDIAVGVILMYRYQAIGDYGSMVAVAEKLRMLGTKAGQSVQMLSILGRMTPEGMMYYAQKSLDDLWQSVIGGKSKLWIEKNKDKFKLTAAESRYIENNIRLASQLPECRDKQILLAKIASLLQDKIPPNLGKSFTAAARVNMLLNPLTNIRNILGNVVITPVQVISDLIGSGIDKSIANKTGVRTTGVYKASSLKGIKKGAYESLDDFKRKINTRESYGDKFEIGEGNSFSNNYKVGRALNAVDRFTSFLLEVGDRPFYEMWFINSLNNQMRLNKVTEPTAEMIEIATIEALERTWQDDNNYTKTVARIRDCLNAIGFSKITKNGIKTHEFGLGFVAIPFIKTTSNLVKAIVDFSPVGLVQTLVMEAARFRGSVNAGTVTPAMQRQFVKHLSQGLTGAMMTVIAMAFANIGTLTGAGDDDKDVASFEKNILGIRPYSFKIGDKSFSYEWMQPVGGTLAIAADTVNSYKKNKDFSGTAKASINSILKALETGGNTLFDQTVFTSIQNIFSEDGLIQGLMYSIMNTPTMFQSSFINQIGKLLDDKQRYTYQYGDQLGTLANKMKYRTPKLRESLEIARDTLGREISVDNSFFNVFLNPANVSTAKPTKASKELYRLYQEVGDKAVIPPVAPSYIMSKNEKIILTIKEKMKYQEITGTLIAESVENLLNEENYKKMSDADKVELLKNIYSYSNSVAKDTVCKDYEMQSSDTKIKMADEQGVNPYKYLLLKDSYDLNGNAVVTQDEVKKVLQQSSLSNEQKAYLYALQNKSWLGKNNPFQSGYEIPGYTTK